MRLLKGRVPAAVVSVAAVVGIVAAASVALGTANPGVAFAQAGHWVFNRSESAVVHIDSGTRAVDARVAVPASGDEPAFAVQGSTQGFLVGRRNITVFGKSTLTVETTMPTGQDELPVGIEAVGGPYLVYQRAGTIVRLGVPPLTVPVGGPVSRPVSTDDGTVWVHRTDTGDICSLAPAASTLDCAVGTAAGAPGSLTITQAVAGYVDTAADAVAVVQGAGLLRPAGLGTDLPDEALIADRDSEDRLPAVTANPNRLVLTDDGGVLAGRAGGTPVAVDLGPGSFSGPVAADGVVAVIDQTRHRLLTFAMDGHALGSADLPPGDATITRGGDGRLYVDDANGARTHVVGKDGSIASIATGTPSDAVVSAQPEALAAAIPAPPDQSLLRQLPGRDTPVTASGPTSDLPGQQPVNVPGPPPIDGPVDPAPATPDAPTGLKVVVGTDGSVNISWNAVAGTGVSYSVQVDGAPAARSAGTSTSLSGLAVGKTYTVTVSAMNGAGPGPASAGVTVTPFGAAASAPKNARILVHEAGGQKETTLFWDAADLAGRDLVGYEVTGAGGQAGPIDQVVTPQGNIPLQFNDFDTYCSSTIQYQVRAITTPPGGGAQSRGPAATASKANSTDCTPGLVLDSAKATGSTTAVVTFHCTGSGSGNVVLNAKGTSQNPGSGGQVNSGKWTGECAGTGETSAALTGLTPSTPMSATGSATRYSTTYEVTGTVSSASGSKASTNSIGFPMPGR